MQPHCPKPTDTGRLCVRRINHSGPCTPAPTIPELLDFEAQNLPPARKGTAIEEQLGLPPARYYQLLNRAIDTQEALEHDPTLTYRLQARRQAASRNRTT